MGSTQLREITKTKGIKTHVNLNFFVKMNGDNLFPRRPTKNDDVEKMAEEFESNRRGPEMKRHQPETTEKRKKSKFAQQRKLNSDLELNSKANSSIMKSVIVEKTFGSEKPFVFTSASSASAASALPFPIIEKLASTTVEKSENDSKKSLFSLSQSGGIEKKPQPEPEMEIVDSESCYSWTRSKVIGSTLKAEDVSEIHDENVSKLNSMSEEEIRREQQNLLSSLDPEIIKLLTNKKKKIAGKTTEKKSVTIKSDKDDEKCKLEWTSEISETPNLKNPRARFDLNGKLMDPKSDVPTHLGLHHHGDEPDRAGYTLEELFHLCRSTFAQQKVVALEVLTHVLTNAKRGDFDGLFNVNLLGDVVESGIVPVLRMGADDANESVMAASLACLTALIYNEFDETCLDLTFQFYRGFFQPSLPTKIALAHTEEFKEFREEKDDLKDSQVLSLDVITALLRMDILDRISYILDVLKPGVKAVLNCLRILIRVARHSLDSAHKILHHPKLVPIIRHYFLPSNLNSLNRRNENVIYDTPVHLAVKLIRILVSWDKNYGVFVNQFNLKESLINYLTFDPNNNQTIPLYEGLKLVLESFRLWKIFLNYNLTGAQYLDFYPMIMKQLLYYRNSVNLTELKPEDRYTHDHGSALIQIIECASNLVANKNNQITLSHVINLREPLETCLEKWISQILNMEKLDDNYYSAFNLISSGFSAVASLYKTIYESGETTEIIRDIEKLFENKDSYMFKLCRSDLIRQIFAEKVFSSSVLFTDLTSGKKRDPENLPSFGCVLNQGHAVTSIAEYSPFNFLTTLLHFIQTCSDINKSLKIKLNLDLDVFKTRKCNFHLTSNWFIRIESYFWTFLSLIDERYSLIVDVELKRILGITAVNLLHAGDEFLAVKLLTRILFKSNQHDITAKLKALNLNDNEDLVKDLPVIQDTYLRTLFPSDGLNERSEKTFNLNGDLSTLTYRTSGECLLPLDWHFMPLLTLHNRYVFKTNDKAAQK